MQPTVTFKDTSSRFINKYFSYIKGKSIENPDLTKSLILHFVILLAISGSLPVSCSRKIEKPNVIAVDIMPIGDAAKPTPQTEAPKPEIKQEEVKKEEPKPLPPKPIAKKEESATKMEKAEKPKPEAKPVEKPSPKKDEKKKPEEKKKQEDQKKDEKEQEGRKKLLKDLEKKKEQAALDDIFADAAAQKDPKPTAQPAQNIGKVEPRADAGLVNQIVGLVKTKVEQNWNIPIGVKDVQNIKVPLYIKLDRVGNVIDVRITDQLKYNTNQAYRVLADTAVWAVKESSPFLGLPQDKFDQWQELELSFDPSQAL